MYDPDEQVYFIPNMSTVIDANSKKIISSPDMAKDGTQGMDGQQSSNLNQQLKKQETKVVDNNE